MTKTHLVVLMVRNYFVNPCRKLLLERVVVIKLVNKFPAFPGTWNILYRIGKHRHITITFSVSTVMRRYLRSGVDAIHVFWPKY
jgi:hypothetical protein